MEHEDNEHWWLAEYSNGEVKYVPLVYLMTIVDETVQEEGCDKTWKEGHEKRTHGTNIGGEKGQDGIKRNLTVYVGDSIVRKTDSTFNKDHKRELNACA